MLTTIRKRDGRKAAFDSQNIAAAIFKAARSVGGVNRALAIELADEVTAILEKRFGDAEFSVEDVQDIVEKVLIETGHAKTAKAYILYRAKRTRIRDARSELMDAVGEILIETSRENANIANSPSAKMLQIASAASKSYYLNRLLPEHIAQAHIRGDIHIHDLDFYGKTLNCVHIPLGKLLKEGFNNGHGYIRPPKRPDSATALAAIILQSSQNDMFGGQSFAAFDKDMAPYVKGADDNMIYQAMEALVYNLNSMHSRAGAQVPFSSLNLGTDTSEDGRRVTKQLLLAYERGLGRGENPIFPNILFKVKAGVNLRQGDPNYDLFKLAVRVASERMNPTFVFCDSSFNKKYGDEIAYMGCRTRLISNVCGPEVSAGRGNLSFTTLNLPRLAIKASKSKEKFFALLDEKIALVIEQLLHRYRVQGNLKVKDLPFLMGQGLYVGSENLKSADRIESAIKNGSMALGFIGLSETLTALFGKHHGESEEMQALGLEIAAFMQQRMNEAVEKYGLNFAVIATPAEGLSGRFAAMDRREYGVIEGVTDKEYYTNSFHIPVGFKIKAAEKIRLEGAYHKYTLGGHISYIEFDAPPSENLEAVEDIIRYMNECDIGYAGINFPIDFCEACGHRGVMNTDVCPVCCQARVRRIKRRKS
jgi:ribonucleoside-triphosphate reductase